LASSRISWGVHLHRLHGSDIPSVGGFRIVKKLPDVLIEEIFAEDLTRNVFGAFDHAQAFFSTAIAAECLGHVPFRTRVEEVDRCAREDVSRRTHLHSCRIDNCGRGTRMVHVD
jgi:hypothetical protein